MRLHRSGVVMIDAVTEFLFRTIGQVVLETLFYRFFYWPGWLILRVITFGKYPPLQSEPHNRYFVSGIPLIMLLVGITIYFS